MKNFIPFLIFFFIILSNTITRAQSKQFSLDKVTNILIDGVDELFIEQSENNIAELTYDSLLDSYITIKSENGIFIIEKKVPNVNFNKKKQLLNATIKVKLFINKAENFSFIGVNKITTKGFLKLFNPVVNIERSNNVSLKISCANLTLNIDSSSDISIKGKSKKSVLNSDSSETNLSKLKIEKLDVYSQDSQNKVNASIITVYDNRDSHLRHNRDADIILKPIKTNYLNNSIIMK